MVFSLKTDNTAAENRNGVVMGSAQTAREYSFSFGLSETLMYILIKELHQLGLFGSEFFIVHQALIVHSFELLNGCLEFLE